MTAATAAAPARAGIGPFVVPLLALAVFINYVDRGNLATAAPLLKDELSLTGTQIGLLTSAFFWSYMPGQVLAGWMSERLNAYRTLALGLAVWSMATLFTGFATGFAMIFALRLVLGVGESAIFPCSSKLIAQHVASHRLGWVNGLMALGVSVGPAFGVFFGGLLMAQFGWRGVFILFGVISIVWLVPWLTATRRLSLEADQPQAQAAPPFAAILRRRELWGAALGHVCGNYGFYFVISWLPLYLVKARGFSVAEMATMSGLIYLAYAAAAMVSGLVTDRWIAFGASSNLARKTASLVGFIGAAASLLACAYAPTDALALTALFGASAALGVISPLVFAIAQTLAGAGGAAKWVGLQNCLGNLSGIVGPIVTGLIIDKTGGWEGAFLVAAAVTLVGVLGWVVMIPKIAPLDWPKS